MLELEEAVKYVGGAYAVFLALLVVYVAIIAARMERMRSELTELAELAEARSASRPIAAAPRGDGREAEEPRQVLNG